MVGFTKGLGALKRTDMSLVQREDSSLVCYGEYERCKKVMEMIG